MLFIYTYLNIPFSMKGFNIYDSFLVVTSLGAFPTTTQASYPVPNRIEHKTILISKQSPFYHLKTFAGAGIISGYRCGNSSSSYWIY